MTPFSTKTITIAVSWGLLGLLVVYAPQLAGAQIIETFPYLETFDSFDLCGETSCPNDNDCLDLGGGVLGNWTQEQSGGLNWAVANHDLVGCGSGPENGDHTGSGGNYMWIHQGEVVASDFEGCDNKSQNGLGCSSFFFNEQIGLISPQFSFADVPASVGINLRYFTYMRGLRTGSMSLWVSTDGASGPWTELHRVPSDKARWIPQIASLSEYRGEPSVHLRFLAEMLPDSGEASDSLRPDPDALADQALDDVNIFLGNASALVPGSEDRATWVDLTTRFGIQGSLLNSEHVAGWFAARRTMTTFGGLNQLGAFVKSLRVFDYGTKSWVEDTELADTDPLSRRRSGAAGNGAESAMLLYGGSEFIGPVSSVLWVDYQTQTLNQLTCTNVDSGSSDPNHNLFPSEGASVAATDSDGEFLVFGGRGIVVQLNFITRYVISVSGSDNCTYESVRASSGSPPPSSRWGHVAAFWRDPSSDVAYLFGHGGRFQPSSTDAPVLFSDTFVFDLDAEEWLDLRVLDPEQQPSRRSFHSAVKNRDGDKMVIYGGLDDTDPSNVVYYSDAFVLIFNSGFVVWKRLIPSGDPPVARAKHTMVPLFFADTTIGAVTDNEEGYLVFGGTTDGGVAINNLAKLNFGALNLPPLPEGGDDDDDPTVAIVLGVILPFCCLLVLLLLCLATLVAGLLTWRGMVKRKIRQKYGINQEQPATEDDIATAMSEIDDSTAATEGA